MRERLATLMKTHRRVNRTGHLRLQPFHTIVKIHGKREVRCAARLGFIFHEIACKLPLSVCCYLMRAEVPPLVGGSCGGSTRLYLKGNRNAGRNE